MAPSPITRTQSLSATPARKHHKTKIVPLSAFKKTPGLAPPKLAPRSSSPSTVASSTPVATPATSPIPVSSRAEQKAQPVPRVEIKKGLGLEHSFVAVKPERKRSRDDGGDGSEEDELDDDDDERESKRRRAERGITPAPQSKGTSLWSGNLEDEMTIFDKQAKIIEPVAAFEHPNKDFMKGTMTDFHDILLEMAVWSHHRVNVLTTYADEQLQQSLDTVAADERKQEASRLVLVNYLDVVEKLVSDLK